MYRKILAAVNEHLNSEASARYALTLARECRAKFYLCFIAEHSLNREAFDRAEAAVRRLFRAASEQGIEAESITETGEPAVEISRIVKQEHIELVFTATRREDVEKRFYFKTTAQRLSRQLPCSVALVRVVHMGRVHPKKILVPLKARIGRAKERAFFTARLAKGFDARIALFHAPEPISRFFHGEIHLTPLEWEEKLPRDMEHFIDQLNRHDVMHEKKLSPGKAGRHITIEAAARRHDLIIMGASERNMVYSFFRGNPVEEVLRETPSDLIILNARHEDQ